MFPTVSRATAVSVCEPLSSARVSQLTRVRGRRVLGAEVLAVDLELDAGDALAGAWRSRSRSGRR